MHIVPHLGQQTQPLRGDSKNFVVYFFIQQIHTTVFLCEELLAGMIHREQQHRTDATIVVQQTTEISQTKPR